MYQKRSKIKPILLAVLAAVLLAAGIAAGFLLTHIRAGGKFYSRNAEVMDLRLADISVEEYEQLRRKAPDSEILWRIPFQGKTYDQNTKELTVSTLSETDLAVLDYFTELEVLEAGGCREYARLAAYAADHRDVQVAYDITIDGRDYDQDAAVVTLSSVTEAEIGLLQYLPKLTAVTAAGCRDQEQMARLQEYCHDKGIDFSLRFGTRNYPDTTRELEIAGATEEELSALALLPELEELYLEEPEASAQTLTELREDYPNVDIHWEVKIAGISFPDDTREVDLSGLWETAEEEKNTAGAAQTTDTEDTDTDAKVPALDLRELGEKMEYLPEAESLFLGQCGLDNEDLAQFREENRENYKVAWTVQLGKKLTARTDDTTFMPVREHVYYFLDEDAYNLRYCEDMVCVDVGHMGLTNIEFVAFMPHLKYLILAHNGQLQDISPISNCKELVFLELDWSAVKDFSPLVGCTSLEDLNIGLTYPSTKPLCQMPWLKNLWMVERGATAELTEALPDTRIVTNANATVGAGWRTLPNYYDMRDMLGMEYMNG